MSKTKNPYWCKCSQKYGRCVCGEARAECERAWEEGYKAGQEQAAEQNGQS